MEVGVKTIVKVGIRFPDLLQHGNIQTQLVDHKVVGIVLQSFETQSLISPILSKVTVHRIILKMDSVKDYFPSSLLVVLMVFNI